MSGTLRVRARARCRDRVEAIAPDLRMHRRGSISGGASGPWGSISGGGIRALGVVWCAHAECQDTLLHK